MPRGGKPKVYPAFIVERVRHLYGEGHTQHEIAAIMGMTQKVIFNVMRRHGIETRVAAKRDQYDKKNSSWKGDAATYAAFHYRLRALFGDPKKCAVCGTETAKHYDYANLTGNYHDMADYKPMCRSCHWKFDSKINNITQAKRRDVDAEA